jgi:DDE superfamily endonuclease
LAVLCIEKTETCPRGPRRAWPVRLCRRSDPLPLGPGAHRATSRGWQASGGRLRREVDAEDADELPAGRHTTSLFAAFDLASGLVIAQPYRRHRHQEFLRFLKLIDAAVSKDLDLHLVLDNYATHKTPAIHQWLLRHPRFYLHFTPPTAAELHTQDTGEVRHSSW